MAQLMYIQGCTSSYNGLIDKALRPSADYGPHSNPPMASAWCPQPILGVGEERWSHQLLPLREQGQLHSTQQTAHSEERLTTQLNRRTAM